MGKVEQALDKEAIELLFKNKDWFQTRPQHQTSNIHSSLEINKSRVTQEELLIKFMKQALSKGQSIEITFPSRMIKLHKNPYGKKISVSSRG